MLRGLELLTKIIDVVLIYDIFGTCKMRLKDSCILTENYRAKKVACSISCKYGVVLQRLVRQAKNAYQPVRFVVNDRGLFTAGWFGVREKYYSSL